MLDQKTLKEILHYDPETGVFTWLKRISIRICVGSVAGSDRSDGYVYIGIYGRRYLAHRLAWFYTYGTWPLNDLDHKDMVKNNNRLSNLREATRGQNVDNTSLRKNNTSGIKGVTLDRRTSKWIAQCWVKSKKTHLGVFENILDAKMAYEMFAKREKGTFYREAIN